MSEKHIATPIVREVKYDTQALAQLEPTLDPKQSELLFQFPMVYVIHSAKQHQVTVYVGETNDIKRRTLQHLGQDPSHREDWEQLKEEKNAQMIVIGHEHFNKSLTLDIENRLMLYLSGSKGITKLNNRRTNAQGKYYPAQERNQIFSKIWRKLHAMNQEVFPLEEVIKDSALFKASPFHELTDEQQVARQLIIDRVASALQNQQTGQLILVEGEAGSGKTVLLSSMFYELVKTLNKQGQVVAPAVHAKDQGKPDRNQPESDDNQLSAALLVNHDEQLKVYEQIMYKLEVASPKSDNVVKPTHFILKHEPTDPVDVVLVDEAHLLWTQGKQTYQGKNQLLDLLKRARVVIAVFDRNQIIATNGYWEQEKLARLERQAKQNDNLITLKHQLRVQGGPQIENWLMTLIQGHRVLSIPQHDEKGYEIKVFHSPEALFEAVKQQAAHEEHGLSRMLATFDWPFIQGRKDENGDLWKVRIGDWAMPWNKQIKIKSAATKRKERHLAWAEVPETINEVGSTFTIQGFDLNYAGVIIGPSVKYRGGKIIFDPKASANRRAKNKRTLDNNQKIDVSQELLQNELNVLLTRGVHGLYLFAVDPALQAVLLEAQQTQSYSMVAEESKKYQQHEDH
ncbi:DUF2075 domain-containing protein [Lacticaseibacillus sp. N501-2]|uniref:DUF2075 domain-containing protein n=1 Tax=Lacticaseibacillus salsurae TaxID=3367729 RepID=UPI0038B300B0